MKAFTIASLLILSLVLTVALSSSSGQNDEKAAEKVSRVKSVLLGGDPKAISEVEKQVVDDRHILIADLISLLEMKPSDKTPEGFLGQPALAAVRLLGEVRAEEAITALADKLELTTAVWIRSPGAGYPCYAALVRIGKAASLECLNRLASEKFPESKDGALGRRELLLMVVQNVEGDDVACFMLKNAIEKEKDKDKDKKANLTAALDTLNERIKAEKKTEEELRKQREENEKPPAPADENKPAAGDTDGKAPTGDELRAKQLEEKLRACIKNELKTVKVFRLPESFLKETNAKITNAREKNKIRVDTHYDLSKDKRVTVETEFFDSADAAVTKLTARFAMSSASPNYIDGLISDKYGDVCFAHPKAITLLRGNVVIEVRGDDPDTVDKAAKAFDDAVKASADLPAAKDGSKFEYPAEFLTENAKPKEPAAKKPGLCPIEALEGYESEKDPAKARQTVSDVADANTGLAIRILTLLKADLPAEQKAYICYLAGEYRSPIYVKELCDVIDISLPAGEKDESRRPRFSYYPAVTALINIGRHAALECLERLAADEGKQSKLINPYTKELFTFRELYLKVVTEVEGREVTKFMLQRAIETVKDKDKKANLAAALALLEKWIKEAEGPAKKNEPPAESPKGSGEAPAASPIEEQLKKGGPKEWEAALAENDKERETIAKFLIEIFKDEKEDAEKRRQAAFLLGKLGTREAVDFLLENLMVHLPMRIEGSDIDWIKGYPCWYSLRYEAGWEKVPAILKYLEAEHNQKELLYLSASTNKIPGEKIMLAVLESEYMRPGSETHKKNLRLMMDYLINRLYPKDLTSDQLKRQELLREKKIEYGQLPEESNKPAPPADENKPGADGAGESGKNETSPQSLFEESQKALKERDQIEEKLCNYLDQMLKTRKAGSKLQEGSDEMKLLAQLADFRSERSTEHLLMWLGVYSEIPETTEKLPLRRGFPVAQMVAANSYFSMPALLKYIPKIQSTRQMHLVIYCLICIAGPDGLNIAKTIIKDHIDSGKIKGDSLLRICKRFLEGKYVEPVIRYDTDLSKDLPEEEESVPPADNPPVAGGENP